MGGFVEQALFSADDQMPPHAIQARILPTVARKERVNPSAFKTGFHLGIGQRQKPTKKACVDSTADRLRKVPEKRSDQASSFAQKNTPSPHFLEKYVKEVL